MLEVVINEETVLSFNAVRFPGHQRQFLDKMDLDMDDGIEVDGQHIKEPDNMQRATYVAMSLILAVQAGNTEMANAMCAYLVHRLPDLKQVRAIENGIEVEMDLLFTKVK
ncbi:MAG: hypothetical protein P8Y24_04365 [Gammaproteobacteria bacterium]|jgi:hypothetical protein